MYHVGEMLCFILDPSGLCGPVDPVSCFDSSFEVQLFSVQSLSHKVLLLIHTSLHPWLGKFNPFVSGATFLHDLTHSIAFFFSLFSVHIMKPAWELQGGLSQRLRGKLESAAIIALEVARSPQAHLDRAWAGYRAYFFSIIFISLVLSKAFHIYAHLNALTVLSLLAWGPTFFLLDILLILGARSLARSYEWRTTRDIAAVFIALFR